MDGHKLKDKQIEILKYLYRFRFLSSIQITNIFNRPIRYTNYHLKVLSKMHCIDKHYSRSLGMANQPAIYYLASGSIKYLQVLNGIDKRALKRIYREKTRSQQFIKHASFITDYFLFLTSNSKKSKKKLHFFTKTDLLLYPYLIHPLPDAYFAQVDKQGKTKRYFLEVVEDTSPRFALRKRVEQYNDYLDSDKFEEATGHSFPTILFICPGIASMIYLKKHLNRIYEETFFDQASIFLATRDQAFSGKWEPVVEESI